VGRRQSGNGRDLERPGPPPLLAMIIARPPSLQMQKVECHGGKHKGRRLIPVWRFRPSDLKHRHHAVCRACRMEEPSAQRRHAVKTRPGFAWRGTNALMFERAIIEGRI